MSEEQKPEDGGIKFRVNGQDEPVMVLTKDGFIYKGQMIEDAGEARQLFVDFLKTANVEAV